MISALLPCTQDCRRVPRQRARFALQSLTLGPALLCRRQATQAAAELEQLAQQRSQQLEQKVAGLQQQLGQAQALLAEERSQHQHAQVLLAEQRSQHQQAQAQLAEERSQHQQAQAQLAEERSQHQQAQAQLAQVQAQLAQAQAREQQLVQAAGAQAQATTEARAAMLSILGVVVELRAPWESITGRPLDASRGPEEVVQHLREGVAGLDQLAPGEWQQLLTPDQRQRLEMLQDLGWGVVQQLLGDEVQWLLSSSSITPEEFPAELWKWTLDQQSKVMDVVRSKSAEVSSLEAQLSAAKAPQQDQRAATPAAPPGGQHWPAADSGGGGGRGGGRGRSSETRAEKHSSRTGSMSTADRDKSRGRSRDKSRDRGRDRDQERSGAGHRGHGRGDSYKSPGNLDSRGRQGRADEGRR
jgi:chemotaxis protein histidine kinase CheA